jgi:hypothetical protein
MNEQMRRWLSTLLSIVMGTVRARPINNVIDEQIPERRIIRLRHGGGTAGASEDGRNFGCFGDRATSCQ